MALLVEATPAVTCVSLKRCPNITDRSASAISRFWPSLRRFNIIDIGITDCGILYVVSQCQMLKAVLLAKMDGCGGVLTEEAVCSVAMHCPAVEELRLNGMYKLSAACLRTVADHCPRLRVFTVVDMPDATDDDVTALVDKCPLLQKLGLPLASSLTPQCLRHIADHCKHLTHVNFWPAHQLAKRNTNGIFPSHVVVVREEEHLFDDDGRLIQVAVVPSVSPLVAVAPSPGGGDDGIAVFLACIIRLFRSMMVYLEWNPRLCVLSGGR